MTRRLTAIAAAVLVAASVSTLGGAPAQAQAQAQAQARASTGYVRLAHLSPDTPEVDVYLSSLSGAVDEQVFTGVGYGVLSAYQALPVGGYTVAMRTSGAPRSAPAVITTQVSVTAGEAYTVAGVGRHADLGLRVLSDDLSLPEANKSKVRIVAASVRSPVLGVSLAGGASIADNVAFATTTDYQIVEPGRWRLMIRPAAGGGGSQVEADLGEGSVYTLLVLDAPAGGIEGRLATDATREGVVPAGGVNTGAGGARTASPVIWYAVGALALLTAAAAGLLVASRRRHSRVL